MKPNKLLDPYHLYEIGSIIGIFFKDLGDSGCVDLVKSAGSNNAYVLPKLIFTDY